MVPNQVEPLIQSAKYAAYDADKHIQAHSKEHNAIRNLSSLLLPLFTYSVTLAPVCWDEHFWDPVPIWLGGELPLVSSEEMC